MHATDIFTYINSWFDGKLSGLSHASVTGRVSCFGISKQTAQKTKRPFQSFTLLSLPSKKMDGSWYLPLQAAFWDHGIYIYIYLEPDDRPLFWGGWPSILWVKSSKMWGPIWVLGILYTRYIVFLYVFFSTRWWVFHVTPSNESKRTLVPSQGRSFQMFLTFGTPSDPWSWESKNSRYEDTDKWASDQFNLLM